MPGRLSRIAITSAALGLGAMSAFVAVPALAEAASGEATASEAVTNRVDSIRQALEGLVDDKTLTDAQADKVADTLAKSDSLRGHRGGGIGGGASLAAAATALGMSEADVRTALRDGTTLAQLAEKQGKQVDDVVAALVAAGNTRLDEAVKAGRLTQAQADERKASLETRIREFVQEGRQAGHSGKGWHHGWGGPGDKAPATPTPSTSPSSGAPSTSPSSST